MNPPILAASPPGAKRGASIRRGIALGEPAPFRRKRGCEHYFGKPRQTGSSHAVFKTPWPGDPRVNIQNDKGKAKAYQVRQVLKAIDKKEGK